MESNWWCPSNLNLSVPMILHTESYSWWPSNPYLSVPMTRHTESSFMVAKQSIPICANDSSRQKTVRCTLGAPNTWPSDLHCSTTLEGSLAEYMRMRGLPTPTYHVPHEISYQPVRSLSSSFEMRDVSWATDPLPPVLLTDGSSEQLCLTFGPLCFDLCLHSVDILRLASGHL